MPEISFDQITFQEAIAYFRSKLVMSADDFALLTQKAKTMSFTVSRISALDVLHSINNEVEKALEEGTTIREFRTDVNDILVRKGYEGLSPWRADTMFRTNIQTAYQVGRYKQMTDPSVLQAKPFWMYSAVGDSRTRPEHMALDGKVYPADHSFWDEWYPPNGYRCRCSVTAMSEADVEHYGLEISEEIPTVVETPQGVVQLAPDKGFNFNPGKQVWDVDLSKYPDEFREAFEDLRSQFQA